MNKGELYQNVIKRMKNFNISFDDAKKEIKEIYPHYSELLDELVAPEKEKVEMSRELWEEFRTLMYIIPNVKEITEEHKQRQLGIVYHLYNKEFDQWN